MKPEPNANTRKLRERLTTETDPVLRRNLTMVIEHLECEAAGELEGLMATMVPEPVFHCFFTRLDAPGPLPAGGTKDRSAFIVLKGGKAVRAMYTELCATRRRWRERGIRVQFEPDMVVVDRHCIVTEGILRYPFSGGDLNKMGFSVDQDAFYLGIGRNVVFWPFDEEYARLLGEDVYADPGFFDGIESRKLALEPSR